MSACDAIADGFLLRSIIHGEFPHFVWKMFLSFTKLMKIRIELEIQPRKICGNRFITCFGFRFRHSITQLHKLKPYAAWYPFAQCEEDGGNG